MYTREGFALNTKINQEYSLDFTAITDVILSPSAHKTVYRQLTLPYPLPAFL